MSMSSLAGADVPLELQTPPPSSVGPRGQTAKQPGETTRTLHRAFPKPSFFIPIRIRIKAYEGEMGASVNLDS